MEPGSFACFVIFLVLLVGLFLLQRSIVRSVLNDLRTAETVRTRLTVQSAAQVVGAAMKGILGAGLVTASSDGHQLERRFTYHIQGKIYEVVLRAELGSADEPGMIDVDLSVPRFTYATVMGMARIGLNYRRAARVRRKIVAALSQADPSAKVANRMLEWEPA